jgi:hypothetical protein
MANSILKVDQINKNSASSVSIADPVTSLALLSATLDASPAVGREEYDGLAFYQTPVALGRGVSPSVYFTSNVADFTMANSSSAQSPFEAARDVLTLTGATTYEMEGQVTITGMGGTTRTTALEFDAGGATLTSIYYEATIATGAANTVSTVFNSFTAVAATAQVLNATVTTAAMTIRWKGLVRVNAGGTFIPQIKFSADPTGTILCKKDSYFKIWAIGSNTVGSVGNWA